MWYGHIVKSSVWGLIRAWDFVLFYFTKHMKHNDNGNKHSDSLHLKDEFTLLLWYLVFLVKACGDFHLTHPLCISRWGCRKQCNPHKIHDLYDFEVETNSETKGTLWFILSIYINHLPLFWKCFLNDSFKYDKTYISNILLINRLINKIR